MPVIDRIRLNLFVFFYWRALQARVTRQTLLKAEEDDSDEEPKEPGRVSLAQLKQRGKKGIIPIVRTGNAIKSECWNRYMHHLWNLISSASLFSSLLWWKCTVSIFNGFCQQVPPEACNYVAYLPPPVLQTVVWSFSMKTRQKMLALQNLSWSRGCPRRPPRQRRMRRRLKDGVTSRYGTRKSSRGWFGCV